jgi:hypothetical protein
MDILSILILLVCIGFGLYLLQLIPMDGTIKQIIIAVAIFLVVIYLLQNLGVFHFGYIGQRH